jgi:hypothetical protein
MLTPKTFSNTDNSPYGSYKNLCNDAIALFRLIPKNYLQNRSVFRGLLRITPGLLQITNKTD